MVRKVRHIAGAAVMATLLSLLIAGCNTTGCTDNQNSLPLAGFYGLNASGKMTELTLDSLDIGGVDAPGDSLLYNASQTLTKIYLPLRSTTPSTSFFIHYAQKALSNPALNDTITFGYTSTPYFASEECGAVYYYHINRLEYTKHLIDSVVLTDTLITNADIERIHIYFRTSAGNEI